MNPYFVMLNCPSGKEITPLKNITGSVILFEAELDAREAGFKNALGKAYGFEIFKIGNGVDHYS